MAFAQTIPFRIARLALVIGLTVLFLTGTSPTNIPALLLIAPFVGIFTVGFLIMLEVVRFLGPDENVGEGPHNAIIRLRRPRLMAAVTAGFPVLLLVLQSIVELTIWDILIAFAITSLAYLYLARSDVSFWRR